MNVIEAKHVAARLSLLAVCAFATNAQLYAAGPEKKPLPGVKKKLKTPRPAKRTNGPDRVMKAGILKKKASRLLSERRRVVSTRRLAVTPIVKPIVRSAPFSTPVVRSPFRTVATSVANKVVVVKRIAALSATGAMQSTASDYVDLSIDSVWVDKTDEGERVYAKLTNLGTRDFEPGEFSHYVKLYIKETEPIGKIELGKLAAGDSGEFWLVIPDQPLLDATETERTNANDREALLTLPPESLVPESLPQESLVQAEIVFATDYVLNSDPSAVDRYTFNNRFPR